MCDGLPHSDRMWLRTNRSPHELRVHGDHDLLIETVANLVDNAVKLTPRLIGSCAKPSPIRSARNSWPRRHAASRRNVRRERIGSGSALIAPITPSMKRVRLHVQSVAPLFGLVSSSQSQRRAPLAASPGPARHFRDAPAVFKSDADVRSGTRIGHLRRI